MNSLIIKGRLTKDPELKQTSTGIDYCDYTVAVDRVYGEETDFFNCRAWKKTAEIVSKFFVKGSEILISGEMQSNKYQDNDGNNRTYWSVNANRVEFCGSKKSNAEAGQPAPATPQETTTAYDDDISF